MTGPVFAHRPAGTRGIAVQRAKVSDVRRIKELVDCFAGPVLLEKTLANLFEDVTEFWVARVTEPESVVEQAPGRDPAAERAWPAELGPGTVAGCGALHVLWEDLGEIRTVATDPVAQGHGVGRAVCEHLIQQARDLGLRRLFVLTFEVRFFGSLGFEPIGELDLSAEAYAELQSSYDAGVAEFLDLPFVKPNTLGNTRMIKWL
nr:amino-acid N-acetyltransferase [Nakamurella leprariae]